MFFQQSGKKPELGGFLHDKNFLSYTLHRRSRGRHFNLYGEFHVGLSNLQDLGGNRRGKKHGLAVLGHRVENSLDLRLEAHIQHPIRFIKHKNFDIGEI